jgi:hypothetical protein
MDSAVILPGFFLLEYANEMGFLFFIAPVELIGYHAIILSSSSKSLQNLESGRLTHNGYSGWSRKRDTTKVQ